MPDVTLSSAMDAWMVTPSSSTLSTAVADGTGSGQAVFGTTPTFSTSYRLLDTGTTFIGTFNPGPFTANRTISFPDQNGRLITATDTGTLAFTGQVSISNPTFVPLLIERTSTTATNLVMGVTQLLATTTQDMVDGFGGSMLISLRDSAAVINNVAAIVGRRAGADNTGSLGLQTYSAGTAADRLLITATLSTFSTGVSVGGDFQLLRTITAAGTTGAQTIDRPSGTVNFAAAASSLVVTNNLVTANSIVYATIRTNDGNATIKNVTPAAGSFTIRLGTAALAETSVGFLVTN